MRDPILHIEVNFLVISFKYCALIQKFSDYSKLVMLYKIGEVIIRLLSTYGFHMKANNDRFTAAGCRRQNLKFD